MFLTSTFQFNSVLNSCVTLFGIDIYKQYINKEADDKKVVTVDASSPGPENWKDLIEETQNVLRASTGGGYIFANYMENAVSAIKQYSYDGTLVREVVLPGVGSAGGFGAKKQDTSLYYSFTNYLTPGSIYSYEIS